jgi:hypothetical protein
MKWNWPLPIRVACPPHGWRCVGPLLPTSPSGRFQIEVDSKPYLLCLASLPQIRGNWNSLGSGHPRPKLEGADSDLESGAYWPNEDVSQILKSPSA